MIEKVRREMDQQHMWPENGNLVLGVSGGADSVCLLHLMKELSADHGLRLAVVHVNHGLRAEAGTDAAFVRSLCEQWDIPFELVEEDVEAFAQKKHLSCEEAGRQIRYEAFFRALSGMDEETGGHGCIAVAHNRKDRAETFLFHLFRGTGLEGMGSIRPVRNNADGSRIIRPLLGVSREEIEAYLRKEGLSWREDATNAETTYTRNRIRNRILPYAKEQICARAEEHLAKEAVLLADTSAFVERQTREALKRCAAEEGQRRKRCFDVEAFLKEDPFLQDQMIFYSMQELGRKKDMTSAHVAQVKKLFSPDCTSGRRVELPLLKIRARRQFGQVVMERLEEPDAAPEKEFFPLVIGHMAVRGLGEIETRLLAGPARYGEKDGEFAAFFQNIPEKKYTKWLDYDKIIQSLGFRTRKRGDYLTINEALSQKSLKRYLIEEKIPAQERESLMLLADGSHIVWVPGHRISAAYKVTAETETILEIRCIPRQEQQEIT